MRTLSWAVGIGMAVGAAVCGQNGPVDWSAMQRYEAHATSVSGQVSRFQDEQPWAVSAGEHVRVQQVIATGPDGYAHFEVAGGSSFDIFANSRVIFRQNVSSAGDLLDIVSGRVRIHLQPTVGQFQLRVFCPVAIISTHQTATIAVGIDEDETARIDVIEGQVRVQHALLPRNEPEVVKAVDAIVVQRNQPISHRVERGCLYRYTVKILSALTLHPSNHSGNPIEGNKLLPDAYTWHSEQGVGP